MVNFFYLVGMDKNLTLDENIHRKHGLAHIQKRYNGVKAIVWEPDPCPSDIKPVFDKMLSALKSLSEEYPDLDPIIKEAEDLGL